MPNLKIDLEGQTLFLSKVVGPSIDPRTKASKVDEQGREIYIYELAAIGPSGAEIFRVKAPGPVAGLNSGVRVEVIDMSVKTWAIDGKSGLSYSAKEIHQQGKVN